MSYECSPNGGCGEKFRSQALFDRHLITRKEEPAECRSDMASWPGIVKDSYGCWSAAEDAEALERTVARIQGARSGGQRESNTNALSDFEGAA